MARIRTIKPEFPQSESVGTLSRDARLLFVQLWTIVDDAGRSRAASRMLASLLYPYDDDAPALIDGWLTELEQKGFVRRYVADGSTYLEVLNWLKHQKIDHPSASRFPEFNGELAKSREDSRKLAPDLGPWTSTKDQEYRAVETTRPSIESSFEELRKVYPKRKGADPRAPALKVFRTFVAAGVEPQAIIDGARRCAEVERDKIGTEFIPQKVKWLRDRRWEDYNADVEKVAEIVGFYAAFQSPELDAWNDYERRIGKTEPRDKRGGWTYPTQWPPKSEERAA